MKKIINILTAVISILLGVITYIILAQSHVTPIISCPIIWIIYYGLFLLLVRFEVLEQEYEIIDFSPVIGLGSLFIGTFVFLSKNFTDIKGGIIQSVIDGVAVYVIYKFILVPIIEWFDRDKTKTTYSGNNYSTSSSYSGSSNYSNYGSSSNYSNYGSSSNSTKPQKETSYSTTYFKDGSSASNVDVGDHMKSWTGIESESVFKDAFGNYQGKATTYDIGFGMKKTVYKDKYGNETEGTTFKF